MQEEISDVFFISQLTIWMFIQLHSSHVIGSMRFCVWRVEIIKMRDLWLCGMLAQNHFRMKSVWSPRVGCAMYRPSEWCWIYKDIIAIRHFEWKKPKQSFKNQRNATQKQSFKNQKESLVLNLDRILMLSLKSNVSHLISHVIARVPLETYWHRHS